MSFDMTSYEMGTMKGRKDATIDADNATFTYDAETKTGTLTIDEGGDE